MYKAFLIIGVPFMPDIRDSGSKISMRAKSENEKAAILSWKIIVLFLNPICNN